MRKVDLLISHNKGNLMKVELSQKRAVCFEIKSYDGVISGLSVRQLIWCVNSLHQKYPKVKVPIHIFFDGDTFIDKLTYVMVESVCYYLIKECGHSVQVFMEIKNAIGTEGIQSSPLLLLNNTKNKSVKLFPIKFDNDNYGKHIRNVVPAERYNSNEEGKIYSDVYTMLKLFNIRDDCRDKVAMITSELVGNSIEHAKSDCLYDIDITSRDYHKDGDAGKKKYYGINIVVLNFSETLLGDGILDNVLESNKEFKGKYIDVKKAYAFHEKYFGDNYTKEDFCNITAFQHKISGRKECVEGIGGRGLTKLIESLEKQSDSYRCYVISGKRAVNFKHEQLQYDENGWIGFNDKNDYLGSLPDLEVVNECFIDMPGTAYNLNFVIEGE